MSLARLTSHDMQAHEYPPDIGCDIASRCLACPLPRCKWEAGRAVYGLQLRDLRLLERHRQGDDDDKLATIYRIDRRSVYRGLARARLYERAVGLSPGPVVREDANRVVDVRVRLHIPPGPKPKRRPAIRRRDWHDRLVILRAWGYSLAMIAYAAGRMDTSSLYHHLREECRCGQVDSRGRYGSKVDSRRAEAA